MKKLLMFTTVALVTAAFAAGPREGRGPMMRGPRGGMGGGPEGPVDPVVRLVANPKVAEKIGLSEEQREKIKELNKTGREGNKQLHETVRAAMERQAELLKADKIDEAAVMAEIDKAFEARKAMAKSQVGRVIAIKALLTPEQVAKALEISKEHPFGKCPKADRPCKGPACDKPTCKGPEDKDCGCDKPCPPPEA